ncbi:MAG TPA: 8-oxo-dGTP diphosphatase [Candidatus Paceibacterota bacterium]|nr:8-oxo-dGTP diphosphatase [Candidatus Paceibacterota bacterium]
MDAPQKQFTLCFVIDGDRILFGMKKTGMGIGWWNGFGGKIEAGEGRIEAAKRELLEESGISAKAVEELGVLHFHFPHSEQRFQVYVSVAKEFSGDPVETDEMTPRWFGTNEVPFDTMWPDDRFWFPLMLAGKKFEGFFEMGEGDTLLKQEVREVA